MNIANFILLCLEGAVLSFNVAATAAVIPSIARDFALSQFFVGKIVWLYMLPYGLAALIYGPLVRKFPAKRVELICLFCFSLANLGMALAKDIHLLFFSRFCMGFFGASVIPLALILIAQKTDASRRGKLVGIFFSATFVASLLGLGLSAFLDWRLIYLIPGVAGLLMLPAVYFYFPDLARDKNELQINYLAVLKEKKVFFIFTYIFCISLLYHGIQQWLGVYFSTSFSFSQFVISGLITLTSLSAIFGEIAGGWLSDHLGRLKTINSGIILMIASAVLLIFKFPVWTFALLMIIWGFGWTLNHAGVSTVITDLPKEFLHESASLNSSVRFISGGLGAAFGGVVLRADFKMGFIIFAGFLVMLLMFSKKLLLLK